VPEQRRHRRTNRARAPGVLRARAAPARRAAQTRAGRGEGRRSSARPQASARAAPRARPTPAPCPHAAGRARRAQVAILCNHQRAVPKGHSGQMEKLEARLLELQAELDALSADYLAAQRAKNAAKAEQCARPPRFPPHLRPRQNAPAPGRACASEQPPVCTFSVEGPVAGGCTKGAFCTCCEGRLHACRACHTQLLRTACSRSTKARAL